MPFKAFLSMDSNTNQQTMKKIHINDIEGKPLYNKLLDDGSNVLRFERGGGFIARDDATKRGWIICEGWIPLKTWLRLSN